MFCSNRFRGIHQMTTQPSENEPVHARQLHLASHIIALLCGLPANPCLADSSAAAAPLCKQPSSIARHRLKKEPAVAAWPRLLARRVAVSASNVKSSSADSPRRPHVSAEKAVTFRPSAGGYLVCLSSSPMAAAAPALCAAPGLNNFEYASPLWISSGILTRTLINSHGGLYVHTNRGCFSE